MTTPREELDHARRLALFEEHKAFARGLALRYWRKVRGLELEDMKQEADLALWMATATWERRAGGRSVPGWAFFYISKRLQEMIKRSCRRPERCSSGDRDAADRRADPAAAAIARLEWQRLLSLLTPRRRDLIERLYSEGWTQQQVADDLHVSKQRVSALLQETLERLESHACP